jgi:hypothetical protein
VPAEAAPQRHGARRPHRSGGEPQRRCIGHMWQIYVVYNPKNIYYMDVTNEWVVICYIYNYIYIRISHG